MGAEEMYSQQLYRPNPGDNSGQLTSQINQITQRDAEQSQRMSEENARNIRDFYGNAAQGITNGVQGYQQGQEHARRQEQYQQQAEEHGARMQQMTQANQLGAVDLRNKQAEESYANQVGESGKTHREEQEDAKNQTALMSPQEHQANLDATTAGTQLTLAQAKEAYANAGQHARAIALDKATGSATGVAATLPQQDGETAGQYQQRMSDALDQHLASNYKNLDANDKLIAKSSAMAEINHRKAGVDTVFSTSAEGQIAANKIADLDNELSATRDLIDASKRYASHPPLSGENTAESQHVSDIIRVRLKDPTTARFFENGDVPLTNQSIDTKGLRTQTGRLQAANAAKKMEVKQKLDAIDGQFGQAPSGQVRASIARLKQMYQEMDNADTITKKDGIDLFGTGANSGANENFLKQRQQQPAAVRQAAQRYQKEQSGNPGSLPISFQGGQQPQFVQPRGQQQGGQPPINFKGHQPQGMQQQQPDRTYWGQ